MTRSELARLLTSLVRRGEITAGQREQMLDLYDAGELDDSQLPMPLEEAEEESDNLALAALLLVALLLGGVYGARLLNRQPGIPLSQRERVRDALRSAFERKARVLAPIPAREGVLSWHRQMAEAVSDHIAQQATVGLSAPLSGDILDDVRAEIDKQMRYLYRFAGRVAVGIALGAALTTGYIAARSTLYAGAGWEWFWRANERGVGQGDGIVVYWSAIDDRNTCDRCRSAERNSPYLPEEPHPWPGSSTCRGLGRCRCTLDYIYDPVAWQRLSGRRLAA